MSAIDPYVDACVAEQDRQIECADFIDAQMQYYKNECEPDCIEAVYDADENKIMATLTLILNESRQAVNGDIDDKIEFTNRVFRFREILIEEYATEKAEFDLEHRHD